jgi:hypothetical protein
MAEIILGCRRDLDKRGNPIITYSDSTHQALIDLRHSVTLMGEGHQYKTFSDMSTSFLDRQALFLDLDCGRNKEGKLAFHCQDERAPTPSAVRWTDSHGYPSYHKRASVNYDHVFFAVWARRELFVKHPSAHWSPCASDAAYFDKDITQVEARPFDVGFFGSKGGLSRADSLKEVCARHNWTTDVREIGKNRTRWPATALAMADCKVLFNHSQKHDSPNQRVIESMLMCRPLVNDIDSTDGMSLLFEPGTHYLPYANNAELANQIGWCLRDPSLASSMARRGYEEAYNKHQVKHRVEQILEVTGVS